MGISDHLRAFSKITHPPKRIYRLRKSEATAFVDLCSHGDAQLVVDNVSGTELGGKKCWVQMAAAAKHGGRGKHAQKKKKKKMKGWVKDKKGGIKGGDLKQLTEKLSGITVVK